MQNRMFLLSMIVVLFVRLNYFKSESSIFLFEIKMKSYYNLTNIAVQFLSLALGFIFVSLGIRHPGFINWNYFGISLTHNFKYKVLYWIQSK